MELSGRFKVIKILKKTKANGWDKVNEGDIIKISLPIVRNSRGGGAGYAIYQIYPTVTIENTDFEWYDSFTKISERMTKTFELIQL